MKTKQNKNKCLTTFFRYIEESMACVNILFQDGCKKKRLNKPIQICSLVREFYIKGNG